jgi:hypothetical protein
MSSTVSPDDPIFKMAELSRKVFESSIDSLAKEELQAINQIVVEAKKVSQFGVSLEASEGKDSGIVELSMVLESLRRVAEYSGDIAEVAINRNIAKV